MPGQPNRRGPVAGTMDQVRPPQVERRKNAAPEDLRGIILLEGTKYCTSSAQASPIPRAAAPSYSAPGRSPASRDGTPAAKGGAMQVASARQQAEGGI